MSSSFIQSSQQALAVIPARFGSTRFPGKPLAAKTGKPLVQHVVERVRKAASIARIIVATDDERIAQAVRTFGGEVMMTRAHHPNGTSRIAEVVDTLGDACPPLVVNIQGDEPEIEPRVIDAAIEALRQDAAAPMSTVAGPFAHDEDVSNPHIVKVVLNQHNRAMYFSRSIVPFVRDTDHAHAGAGGDDSHAVLYYKHVGLYVYRREFLAQYLALSPTPLEQAEQLEQLRVLEHGHAIAVAIQNVHHHGIDTPEQYADFVQRWGKQSP